MIETEERQRRLELYHELCTLRLTSRVIQATRNRNKRNKWEKENQLGSRYIESIQKGEGDKIYRDFSSLHPRTNYMYYMLGYIISASLLHNQAELDNQTKNCIYLYADSVKNNRYSTLRHNRLLHMFDDSPAFCNYVSSNYAVLLKKRTKIVRANYEAEIAQLEALIAYYKMMKDKKAKHPTKKPKENLNLYDRRQREKEEREEQRALIDDELFRLMRDLGYHLPFEVLDDWRTQMSTEDLEKIYKVLELERLLAKRAVNRNDSDGLLKKFLDEEVKPGTERLLRLKREL